MSANATVTALPHHAAPRNWEKIGNCIVLLAYSAVVLFTVQYHEKWSDEAQAWLIARDLDLKTIWFHELRYEGHPGLWHTILWVAQHVFHVPYAALGYIGVAFAIAGVAVLLFKAPFPWYVRWPLAFTYVMVYQYAVIARPYTLLPLLCFTAAIFFKDKQRPERLTVVLVLLASLTFHGTMIAACLGVAYLMDSHRVWPHLEPKTRDRYFVCIAAMAIVFLALFFILKTPPDASFFAKNGLVKEQQPTAITKLSAIVSGAFLDFAVPSAVFLLLAAAWTIWRKQYLAFVLPVGCLLAFYASFHGSAHHHGTAFVAAITGIWIAWPDASEEKTFTERQRTFMRGMIGLLLILCAVNIWDAAVVIEREYKYPYSGAEDAANYLKAAGADRGDIFGYMFGVNAVQAYFDHKILSNWPTAYVHLSITFIDEYLDLDQISTVRPEYIVIAAGVRQQDLQTLLGSVSPPLSSVGYTLVHVSDGYMFTKRAVYEREVYFIFRRVQP
jgi:hypothetical protein